MNVYRVSIPLTNGKIVKSISRQKTPEEAMAAVLKATLLECEARGWNAYQDRISYVELNDRLEVVGIDLEEAELAEAA